MRVRHFFISWLPFLAGITSLASAQEMIVGDPVAGGQLYAAQCVACHGNAGNSIIPQQPIVAGQHAEYTASQLHAYKDGSRVNAIMQTFAIVLSDKDIDDLSVYLEGQTAGLAGVVDESLALAGQDLYRNGKQESNVPNCTGCHGPAGIGIPPLYPRLSGQHAAYTAATLMEFRSGARVDEVMNDIAAGLSDEDIQALSEYIAGLH